MTSTSNKRKANEISYAHAEQNGIINNGGSQTPPIVSASSSHNGTPGTLNTQSSDGQLQTIRPPITTNYIMPPTATMASVPHPYPSYHPHPNHLVQQQHHLPTPVASNTSSSSASNANTTTTTNVPVDGSISGGAVMPTMCDVPHYYPPGAASYPYPASFPGMPMAPSPSYPYACGPGHGYGHRNVHAGHGSHVASPHTVAPAEDSAPSSPFSMMEKYDAILSSIDFEICNILTQEVNIVERATVAAGKSTSITSNNDITNGNIVQDYNRESKNVENKEEQKHSPTSNKINTTTVTKSAEVVEKDNGKVNEEHKEKVKQEKENTHPNTNSGGSSSSTITSKGDATATTNTKTSDDANNPISMIAPSWDQLMVRLLYDTNRRKKELQLRKDRVLRSIQDQLALDHAASRKMTTNSAARAGVVPHHYQAGAVPNTSDMIGTSDGSVSVGSTTSCARSVGPGGHSHGSVKKKIRRVCHGEGRRSPYKHDHDQYADPSSRVSHSSRGSQASHRPSSSRVRTRDNSTVWGAEEGHRHRHRSEPRRHGHGYNNHHGGAGAEPLGSRTITNESRGSVADRHV